MADDVIVLLDSDDEGPRGGRSSSPLFIGHCPAIIDATADSWDRSSSVPAVPDFEDVFGVPARRGASPGRISPDPDNWMPSPAGSRSVTPQAQLQCSPPLSPLRSPTPTQDSVTRTPAPPAPSPPRPSLPTSAPASPAVSRARPQAPTLSNRTFRKHRSLQEVLNEARIFDVPADEPIPEEGSLESKKKRKEVNPEEQSERERKRIAREEAKEAEKEARKLARDTAKAAKEAEKSYQRKLAEVNRLRTTKVDALRDIEIHMSHDLSLPSSPIAGAMPELQTRVTESLSSIVFTSEEETIIPGVIRFRRRVRGEWDSTHKRYIPLDEERLDWEATVVLVASGEHIVDRIASESLVDWIGDVRLTLNLPKEQMILLVRGLEKYHARTASILNRAFRESARAGLAGKELPPSAVSGRIDKAAVEAGLIRAQVVQRVFVVQSEKTEDIEDWLFNLAGDIALRPYKLLSKSHLPFSAPEGIRKAATPGESLSLMLQELQGLTASAASGIVGEYGSFRGLMAAYESEPNPEDMVAECPVRMLRNGTATNRKVGKALSKRLYNMMRGEDALALT